MNLKLEPTDEAVGSTPRCGKCGSSRVSKDAWACWDPDLGRWTLQSVFDNVYCHDCDRSIDVVWSSSEESQQLKIRALNDRLRTEGRGVGTILVTSGLQQHGGEFVSHAVAAVRDFNAFSKDNDPWGEHDFGAVDVGGTKVFFKIDYYNADCTAGSEDPTSEELTYRVLTIMLATEY